MSVERTERAIQLARQRMRDPISVEPFLCWAVLREREIGREIDRSTLQIGGNRAASNPLRPERASNRLLTEIGWELDAGDRRMFRWVNESLSGLVERADIEDALHRAGVQFDLIYPQEAKATRRVRIRLGDQRRMTDREVVAAHTVYVRGRMTTTTLAELIYLRFGYASALACARSLSVSFRGLGLPLRRCAGEKVGGGRCERPPGPGIDYCPEHAGSRRPSEIGGRRSAMARTARAFQMPPDLLAQARILHLDEGKSFREVGDELLPLVPWRSADHLAQRLADVAYSQGWHTSSHRDRQGKAAAPYEASMGNVA